VFTLYLIHQQTQARGKCGIFSSPFYLHIDRLWLDAAHWHSAVIRAKTSDVVDQPDGRCETCNALRTGLSGGQGVIPAGWLHQSGQNRFIKWPGWLAVRDHCWWSIWHTVIFSVWPAGTHRTPSTMLLSQPSEQAGSDSCLFTSWSSSELLCSVIYLLGNQNKGS